MADKPRNPGRFSGGPEKTGERAPKAGSPGGRPGFAGRGAGKPGTGPASPRKAAGGFDQRVLEKLAAEGMLSAEGRRFFAGQLGEGGARKGGPAGRMRPDRTPRPEPGADEAPAAAPRGARPAGRLGLPAPTGGAARPAMPRPRRDDADGQPRTRRDDAAPRREPRPGRAPAAGKPARFQRGTPEALVAERLHKVMAQAGVASRRHSEELIQAGRVTVNGRVVSELGTRVIPGKDLIEVDGRPLGNPEDLVYILLNKPKGYVTTLYDPQGRPKVTDLLGEEIAERVYPVGRLDYDTEGLLLLTNDGELANALMHPAKMVKKTYIAKVRGVPGPAKLKALEEGIELEDGPTAPAEVKLLEARGPNAATVSVRIHEGRNRQVRRMFEAVGHEVIHLKRTTQGPLSLGDMAVGQWRELTDREVRDLKGAAGIRQPISRGAKVAAIVAQRKAAQRGAGRPGAARTEEPAMAGRPVTGRPTVGPRRPKSAGTGKNRRPK